MKKIYRNECLLTGNTDIEHAYTFKHFPVYMGCTEELDSNLDLFSNMVWGYSKSSGNIQLMELIDLDILYQQHHNPGTIGKTWQQHHNTFYNFIKKHGYNNVLEIGGASGSLIKCFLPEQKDFSWTIIEPSKQNPIDDKRVKFAQGYFENFEFKNKFDTIIHSHVFEHVYDPLTFLKEINKLLELGDRQYISIPNIKHWLEQGYTNALMFEHTFFVDINVLEYLLNKSGFEIVDKISDNHSIMVCCVKSDKTNTNTTDFNYVKDLYLEYVNKLIEDTNQIKKSVGDNKFYLFGAHIFSQILINLGLPESQIIKILDNDTKKHNLRLYGTTLMVDSPKCLQGLESPIVVLRGGVYTNEIKNIILDINPTTQFL